MWIYNYPDWPHLQWDDQALSTQLAETRHAQGRLLGRLERVGFALQQDAHLNTLTNDVVHSSAIEGEHLYPQEVRSSIAGRLGIDIADKVAISPHVEGIVDMMLDATEQCAQPLSKERLLSWHAALFPTGRSGMLRILVGAFRTIETGPMQVVSGPIGKETVHFEAPSADRLEKEMHDFLTWFEQPHSIDPFLKAGIAHLWFVSIHPFEDGNGRIARAISDMILARCDNTPYRFYSLSSQIKEEREQYYHQLEKQQKSPPDITEWLAWFLTCLHRAIQRADHILEGVLYKTAFWNQLNQHPVNSRQRLILNRMLEDHFQGHMNTSKYAKMAHCSQDTALRDIQALKERGVLIPNPGKGRRSSYRLVDKQDFLAHPG